MRNCKVEGPPSQDGPLQNIEVTHGPAFMRCSLCEKVLCGTCAAPVLQLHGKDFDTEGVEEARAAIEKMADVDYKLAGHRTEMWQHPHSPVPFFVINQEKPNDKEKLEWMFQELPQDTEILEFSQKFIDLFGGKFTTEKAQKDTTLRLFAIHTGRKIKKKKDLEPDELELFELAWDSNALARCKSCKGTVANKQANEWQAGKAYCKPECRFKGIKISCKTCHTPTTASEFLTCRPCNKRRRTLPDMFPSELSRTIIQQHEFHRMVHNGLSFEFDTDSAPSTKRRRT